MNMLSNLKVIAAHRIFYTNKVRESLILKKYPLGSIFFDKRQVLVSQIA